LSGRANEVAAQLVGSCQDLSAVATEAERNDMQFCVALDALVMCCELCGWWVDAEEINTDSGEALCDDCLETT
jgi:hypothetical protein